METSATNDEGEPSGNKKLFFLLLFIFITLFIIASCTEKKKEIKKEKPAIDSVIIQLQQQHLADSLLKAKKVVPKKKIYLTFDDGPNDGTMNVFNAVKEDSIPVSFFIVGKHVADSPEQSATWNLLLSDSAIDLCNHSYTHASGHYTRFYSQPATVVKDIEHNEEKLAFHNNVVRMPGRNAWRIGTINRTDIKESKEAIDSVGKAGFSVMGWDVEWMFDHKTLSLITDPDLLLRQIQNMLDAEKTKTPGNLVVLAHDQAFQTEAAIEKLHYFFSQLKNNSEYELVLASNYPGVK